MVDPPHAKRDSGANTGNGRNDDVSLADHLPAPAMHQIGSGAGGHGRWLRAHTACQVVTPSIPASISARSTSLRCGRLSLSIFGAYCAADSAHQDAEGATASALLPS